VLLERWFTPAVGGKRRLDLWTAVADQLEAGGVDRAQIYVARLCTAEQPDLFWSYRRDGAAAGRMAALIRPRETAQ
jgi:copper oxidase (laccase) domain-containing protein